MRSCPHPGVVLQGGFAGEWNKMHQLSRRKVPEQRLRPRLGAGEAARRQRRERPSPWVAAPRVPGLAAHHVGQ